jgi:HEPN domain-containing protein
MPLRDKWIEQADADLGAARSLLSAAFHDGNVGVALVERCRAAAEGYVKALLIQDRVRFPETAGLMDLLDLADLGLLPSDVAPLTEPGDPHRAIAAAIKVKEAVLDILDR